jgi:hypothetical protein
MNPRKLLPWNQNGSLASALDAGVLHTSHDRAISGIAEFSKITITP